MTQSAQASTGKTPTATIETTEGTIEGGFCGPMSPRIIIKNFIELSKPRAFTTV